MNVFRTLNIIPFSIIHICKLKPCEKFETAKELEAEERRPMNTFSHPEVAGCLPLSCAADGKKAVRVGVAGTSQTARLRLGS